MTLVEQQLMKEIEQLEKRELELLERLETQEKNFLTALEKVVTEFKTHLENDKKELESLNQELVSLRAEQGNLFTHQKQMNEILTNLPSYEILEQDLKRLLQLQGN